MKKNLHSNVHNVREYRHKLSIAGQASPPFIGRLVSNLIQRKFPKLKDQKSVSILDVGCGLGSQMKLIAQQLPDAFSRICGLDWSPATVEFHLNDSNSIYDEVLLCDSSRLPFEDGAFDIALSMENLEHLYGQCSKDSLHEMSRIAKYLIVTTPFPPEVINFSWIYPEIVEAINDPVPLSNRDFICLESAVHKSTIFPSSMISAGFSQESKDYGVYFGETRNLNIELVQTLGISSPKEPPNSDYKWSYVSVLAESASLHKKIISHPLYTAQPVSLRKQFRELIYALYKMFPENIRDIFKTYFYPVKKMVDLVC